VSDREQAIVTQVVEGGRRMAAVARDFGISRQRVFQIVKKNSPEYTPPTAMDGNTPQIDPVRLSELARYETPVQPSGPTSSIYTDAQLLSDLRDAGRVSMAQWNAHRPEGAASARTYIKRFGSWSEALIRAGLDPTGQGSRFSYDAKVEAVQRFLTEAEAGPDHRFGQRHYQQWALEHPEVPRLATIKQGASWSAVRAEAVKRSLDLTEPSSA